MNGLTGDITKALALSAGALYGILAGTLGIGPAVRSMWRTWKRRYGEAPVAEETRGWPWLGTALGTAERGLYMLALYSGVAQWITLYLTLKVVPTFFRGLQPVRPQENPKGPENPRFEGFKMHLVGVVLSLLYAIVGWQITLFLSGPQPNPCAAVLVSLPLPAFCAWLDYAASANEPLQPREGCRRQRIVRALLTYLGSLGVFLLVWYYLRRGAA